MKRFAFLILVSFLVQSCADTRYSYIGLLEENDDTPMLRLQKGSSTEVLAVGNGFPGWWGYYPWVISSSPEIASVDCQEARGFIPFRAPGVVFGGTVCNLTAHNKGKMALYFGNQFTLSADDYRVSLEVLVIEN